jgi:hypothetical protein
MIIGTNWMRGYSHTSRAKDTFIKSYHTRKTIVDILEVFLSYGIDAVVGGEDTDAFREAILEVQQRTGHRVIQMLTPHFNVRPGGPADMEPERVFDRCRDKGATFCMPHQCVTDTLLDRVERKVRGWDVYARQIRDRGMIPGFSTHLPETIVMADESRADAETYIQIYNAAGFLMPLEPDWVMKVIHKAKKPVLTIKPLAAGRLIPVVGLSFVWSTLRPCDMVAIGTMSPDEARECIEISLALLEHRPPLMDLQATRSKKSLESR